MFEKLLEYIIKGLTYVIKNAYLSILLSIVSFYISIKTINQTKKKKSTDRMNLLYEQIRGYGAGFGLLLFSIYLFFDTLYRIYKLF